MYKLGRSSVIHDPQRRMLATTLLESLPKPPRAVDNRLGVTDWGMMANGPSPHNPPEIPEGVGDCTIVGLAHNQQVLTLDGGRIERPTTAQVVAEYSRSTGYILGDPSTDLGGNELKILTGIEARKDASIFGQKLLGFVSPDPKNLDHVRKAIAYFRCLYLGGMIPASVNGQTVWTPVLGSPIEGGHCYVAAAYSEAQMPIITWGMNQPVDWDWHLAYTDEAHVLVWESTLKLFPASTQQTILNMLQAIN